MTKNLEEIFKTSDLNFERLQLQKKKCINKFKEIFTENINRKHFSSFSTKDGYYSQPIYLEVEHLNYVFETKKAFIKYFFTKYPKFNVPYDSKNLWATKNLGNRDKGEYCLVRPAKLARHRDLLFGTNGVEAITVNNWRERIRDAQSEKEIEEIKELLINNNSVDDFIWGVEFYTHQIINYTRELRDYIKKPTASNPLSKYGYGLNGFESTNPDHFYEDGFKFRVKALEKILEDNGNFKWGLNDFVNKIHHQAKIGWPHYVALELLEKHVKAVLESAKNRAAREGISYDWKPFPNLSTKKPLPVSAFSVEFSPQPDPNDSGYESENIDPEVDKKKEEKIAKLRKKAREVNKKARNQNEDLANNPSKKREIEKEISELEQQIHNAKEGEENINTTILAELQEEIRNLKDQLKIVTKALISLQEYFQQNPSALDNLKQYFLNNKIKSVRLENDKWIIDYEEKSSLEFEVDGIPELLETKNYLITNNRSALMKDEVVGSSNIPELDLSSNKLLYIVGGGIALLIGILFVGMFILIKKQKRVEQE